MDKEEKALRAELLAEEAAAATAFLSPPLQSYFE